MKVKDLFDIKKGKKIEISLSDNKENTIRYLQIEDLRGDNNLKYAVVDDKSLIAREMDVIVAWDGANAGTVGFGLEGAVGSTLAVLQPKEDIDTAYVGLFLKSKSKYLRENCTGATIPHLQRQVLENIEIPLPSFNEQKRIASILNEAQSLIDNHHEAIRKLDEFLKLYFMWSVGPNALDYDTWEPVILEDLAAPIKGSMRTGPFGSDLKHSEFIDDPQVAVLGIDNAVYNHFAWGQRRYISYEKYEKLKRYTVNPEDVIITIMGTTGRSAVVPKDIMLSIATKHLVTITVNKEKVLPYYLSYAIHSHPHLLEQIERENKGAIMNGLNLTIIKELKIKLPPIDLQEKFLTAYEEVQKRKIQLQNSLQLSEEMYGSVFQEMIDGLEKT